MQCLIVQLSNLTGSKDDDIRKHLSEPGIHGRERVVQQVDVQVRVERPRQVHSLPLSAGQGHPPLTDQSQVTLTKDLDVQAQL